MTNNNFENLIDDNNQQVPQNNFEPVQNKVIEDTYTDDEIRDVNNITVTIPDQNTPIVVFFGSPASGKTLAMLRLIRYLEGRENCQVVPEEVFRPHSDRHYAKMCKGLKEMAYNTYAPGGNDVISFMLLKVLNPIGKPMCQILEAPGEHYFDGTPQLTFPTYINHIRTCPNKKVWVFFVEQGWGTNQGERNLYAQKICSMQGLISPNDRVVFLFNKVDRYRQQYKNDGTPNKEVFFTNIQNQYPGIFTKYENRGLNKVLYGPYKFKAVCFSSGVFNMTNDGREVWTPEKDWYCQELWNAIR